MGEVLEGELLGSRSRIHAGRGEDGVRDADAVLAGAGVDPRSRPEELSHEDFARVASALTA